MNTGLGGGMVLAYQEVVCFVANSTSVVLYLEPSLRQLWLAEAGTLGDFRSVVQSVGQVRVGCLQADSSLLCTTDQRSDARCCLPQQAGGLSHPSGTLHLSQEPAAVLCIGVATPRCVGSNTERIVVMLLCMPAVVCSLDRHAAV